MKVISFNANGIRSAARKGFLDWLMAQNADFVCIQETKAHRLQLQAEVSFFPQGYHCEYVDAQKKGYSGVAIYARHKPEKIIRTLGFESADQEGRYLQFDYPEFSIASIYFPSGTSGEVRQAVKFDFLKYIARHFQHLKDQGKPVILCGDYNIAHKNIDLKNWRNNQKNSGFLPEERAWLDQLFGPLGFIDTFRLLKPTAEEYTWWSNRGSARANNVGWRIDYQVITSTIAESVSDVSIYRDTFFSDHAPLIVQYQGGWCV